MWKVLICLMVLKEHCQWYSVTVINHILVLKSCNVHRTSEILPNSPGIN